MRHLDATPLFLLEIIVIHLDTENNGTRDCRDDIGDEQRPVLEHQALDGKEDAAQAHHQEGGQRNTIGVMGTDGVDSLRHVTQDEADARGVTDDIGQVVGDKIHHSIKVFYIY